MAWEAVYRGLVLRGWISTQDKHLVHVFSLSSPSFGNYKIMVTLTRERVIEAAPIDSWRRAQLADLLEKYPWCEDKVFWEAWEQLIKWYRYECRKIGERRPFWGFVYRLLDDPTADDIA